jgi:hypothetical protein
VSLGRPRCRPGEKSNGSYPRRPIPHPSALTLQKWLPETSSPWPAYQNLQGVSSIDALLQTLLTAASDAVQKYCKRDFVSTAYDELYSGNGDRRLMLRQYPTISVESVRYRPVTVLKITTVAANVQVVVYSMRDARLSERTIRA